MNFHLTVAMTIVWAVISWGPTATAAPIPLTTEAWELSEQGANFVNFKGHPSLRVNGGRASLKNANFKNGIIEYDVWMEEARGFGGVYFRSNNNNAEYFYMRPHLSGKPDANQYVPMFNGNAAWQIFHGERYSAPTVYNFGQWIHVKLAIKDDKMDVYIDSDEPVLHIDNLLLDGKAGEIRFSGGLQDFYYANINIIADENVLLKGTAKPLKPLAPGLIREFDVTQKPVEGARVEAAIELDHTLIASQTWTRLLVGETGVANLSEIAPRDREANTLLVRLKVDTKRTQTIPVKYGFSDRVTIFLNGKAIAHGNDSYVSRDYRYLGTVGLFDTVFLPLEQGQNEVIFAVTEAFGGWAFLAAVDAYEGVTVK